jgi:hypothetical protein
MNARIVLLAGAALFAAQAANAKAPTISGNYNYSMTEYCQPVIDPWPSGSSVFYTGQHTATTAMANFNASTGQVSINGETLSGDVMVTNSTAGTMAANAYSLDAAYSNTGKLLTINGKDYNVDYKYVQKGLAQSFRFYRRETAGTGVTAENCVVEGNASMER